MNADLMAAKVRYGYGKAADLVGRMTNVYRPNGASSPVSPFNCLWGRLARIDTVPYFTLINPQKYNAPLFYAMMDSTDMEVGDYLVQGDTYFAITVPDIGPVEAVICNAVVTVTRTSPTLKAGQMPYGASTTATDAIMLQSWPASALLKNKGERLDTVLPGDTKTSAWEILLPASVPITLRTSDIIADTNGRRWIVGGAELTFLGWRILAQQEAA